MDKIVAVYEDEPRVSSFDIATGFDKQHNHILKMISKHKESLVKFGALNAQKIKTKGRPIECIMLTENQALYLGTIFRDNEKVIEFKVALIKEFSRMKKALSRIESRNNNPDHIDARNHGKIVRRLSTDAMDNFVEYAKAQGSENADKYYQNLTRMENSLLFIVEGKYKNLRNVMSSEQLMIIGVADRLVRDALLKGMKDNVYYKDIYKQARDKVAEFAKVNGQSNILDLIDVNPQIQLSLSS